MSGVVNVTFYKGVDNVVQSQPHYLHIFLRRRYHDVVDFPKENKLGIPRKLTSRYKGWLFSLYISSIPQTLEGAVYI